MVSSNSNRFTSISYLVTTSYLYTFSAIYWFAFFVFCILTRFFFAATRPNPAASDLFLNLGQNKPANLKQTKSIPFLPRSTPDLSCRTNFVAYTTTVICLPASSDPGDSMTFDTDSRAIKVDNCSSYSISPFLTDFEEDKKLAPHMSISHFGGTCNQVYTGTIIWTISNDNSANHEIRLPGSLYVPGCPTCLLSPQHWAQCAKYHSFIEEGTQCITVCRNTTLYWDQQRRKRTLSLDPGSGNVGTFHTSAGYARYQAFLSEASTENNDIMTSEGDEDLNTESDPDVEEEDASSIQPPAITSFDFMDDAQADGLTSISSLDTKPLPEVTCADFLRWHLRLGHASPTKIKALAKLGILPGSLATCKVPLCTACMFGMATRKPWRYKPAINRPL